MLPQEICVKKLTESKCDPTPHADTLQWDQNPPRVGHQLTWSYLKMRDNLSQELRYRELKPCLKGKLIKTLPSRNVPVDTFMRQRSMNLYRSWDLIDISQLKHIKLLQARTRVLLQEAPTWPAHLNQPNSSHNWLIIKLKRLSRLTQPLCTNISMLTSSSKGNIGVITLFSELLPWWESSSELNKHQRKASCLPYLVIAPIRG